MTDGCDCGCDGGLCCSRHCLHPITQHAAVVEAEWHLEREFPDTPSSDALVAWVWQEVM